MLVGHLTHLSAIDQEMGDLVHSRVFGEVYGCGILAASGV
jgi:hypothetical protein